MSQKYVAVHFFTPQPNGFRFHKAAWPPHVTILPRLTLGTSLETFTAKLKESVQHIQPFKITITGPEFFGQDQTIPVLIVDPSPDILKTHTGLLKMCVGLRCTYDEPAYNGAGYRPHVSVQKNNTIEVGQTFPLDTITLVDMYPDGDITQRLVLETYTFGE